MPGSTLSWFTAFIIFVFLKTKSTTASINADICSERPEIFFCQIYYRNDKDLLYNGTAQSNDTSLSDDTGDEFPLWQAKSKVWRTGDLPLSVKMKLEKSDDFKQEEVDKTREHKIRRLELINELERLDNYDKFSPTDNSYSSYLRQCCHSAAMPIENTTPSRYWQMGQNNYNYVTNEQFTNGYQLQPYAPYESANNWGPSPYFPPYSQYYSSDNIYNQRSPQRNLFGFGTGFNFALPFLGVDVNSGIDIGVG